MDLNLIWTLVKMDTVLEKAILDTVRYFDLFDMPLTVTQLWRCLIIDSHGTSAVRWGGHRRYSLREVKTVLTESLFLRGKLGNKSGFFFLSGRDGLFLQRMMRHALAQDKWKIMNRLAPWMAAVPFVRALAGSGSFALSHTKPTSDLDVFAVVHRKRIWTTRLLLLLVMQLSGRRRKYWNVQAPDKVCLNHYVTDDHLSLPAAVANLYTAVQYTLHTPIYGVHVLQHFRSANAGWIHRYVMASELPHVHHRYTVRLIAPLVFLKHVLEGILLEPIGDAVERMAEYLQRVAIERHSGIEQTGRIVANSHELAFHPDTKVPALLGQYYQEAGQQRLFT